MRRKRRLWSILMPLLAFGCHIEQPAQKPRKAVDTPPPAPTIEPAPAPRVDDGCSAACANLERLGGCKALPRTMTCMAACKRLNGQLDVNGNSIRSLDTDCLAAAGDCRAVNRCD